MEPNLLLICLASFISVFLLLSVLSLIITITNKIFPAIVISEKDDFAIIAAINSATKYYFPNSKITNIEELK